MTAGEVLQPPRDEHLKLKPNRPWSPPIKSTATAEVVGPASRRGSSCSSARKRPRTSSSSILLSATLPPNPPHGHTYNYEQVAVGHDDLARTRPRSSNTYPPGNRAGLVTVDPCRTAHIPYLGIGGDGGDYWSASSDDAAVNRSSAQLSKSAKMLEEDRKKVASIRSFLLNFLEERDCSIKKRLDLCVHQTETGRPVNDTVVQEVCKLRPDMIGLSLRNCIEVTDVGLWCIARHTNSLRELNISGCHAVTNIGLRSLAIRCDKMEQLDFTSCTRLTDLGLRVLGGGCWSLKSLSLEGCANVSDTGVAELAKLSTGLTYLNISRCERVGEYGDRALIQLGRSCHELRRLDAFGCSHAQDPGLLAVARGCPKLEKLMLTGCGGITGKSVRALARGCTALRDLSLSGCGGVGNGDIKALARGCTSLRHLNIAECAQVNAHGLAALALGLKNLTELDVGGCERVDDSALRALCSMNAHSLNLSGCAAITESGVAGIAMNCTALSSLNVTGCPGISRRFMAELCHSMKFSEPAQAFFGFQPRKNAKELLAKKEELNRRIKAAVVVQAHMRGLLARGRASIVRRNWIIKTRLAGAQALTRGYFTRRWYRTWRAQVREQRAAATIQATWRMLGDRRTAERLRGEKIFREMGHTYATRIQAGWMGHRGRVRAKEVRAIRARQLLLAARVQTRRELAAIMIQSNLRRLFAQKRLVELRSLRDEALALEKRRQDAAVLIQSLARMRQGRAALAVLKARRDRKILEWEMALRVQAAWRGRVAKMVVMTMRIVREQARQKAAAITIQSFWRAVRARHLTAIQRALFKIRQIQSGSAGEIQRLYRGFKGRLRFKARRALFKENLRREAAAMTVQRVYRGHKGREKFECQQHLRALEDQARPLLLKLDELTETAAKLSGRAKAVATAAGLLRAEHLTMREELYHIRHTTDKYTDSDKITGRPQRFLTKFLQVRLVELKESVEARLEKLDAEAIEVEVKERHNNRLLRQTERELIPLGRGTVEKVKILRTSRLRKQVRLEKSASITIQRLFRGWRVRKAVNSWYRDYWIESQDVATGDVYYVNTWNQEVRWVKPLEISLFERTYGTGNSLEVWEADDDDANNGGGGGSVGSVSSRFRQRLVDLTGAATLAAEEEEHYVQCVAANLATITAAAQATCKNGSSGNGGTHPHQRTKSDDPEPPSLEALALAAAREWRYVGTDATIPLKESYGAAGSNGKKANKCWYNAETFEYFWGSNPPLLGLFLRSGDGPPWMNNRSSAGGSFRGGGSTSASDGSKVSDAGSDDVGEEGRRVGVVHPTLGLVFADRAAGEAWLRIQHLGALLETSKKVCDIGTAGWSQLRAGVSDSSTRAAATALVVGEGAVTVSGGGGGCGKGGGGNHSPYQIVPVDQRSYAARRTPADAAAAGGAASPEAGGKGLALHGGGSSDFFGEGNSLLPAPFTFFHHSATGQVRWCLSPRSALLQAPRTPRREALQATQTTPANAAANPAAAAEHLHDPQPPPQQQQGWDSEASHWRAGGDFEEAGVAAPNGETLSVVDGSGGGDDEWEVVEDEDVVFYYNKRLGISTWEPPPGWEPSAYKGESHEAGG